MRQCTRTAHFHTINEVDRGIGSATTDVQRTIRILRDTSGLCCNAGNASRRHIDHILTRYRRSCLRSVDQRSLVFDNYFLQHLRGLLHLHIQNARTIRFDDHLLEFRIRKTCEFEEYIVLPRIQRIDVVRSVKIRLAAGNDRFALFHEHDGEGDRLPVGAVGDFTFQ